MKNWAETIQNIRLHQKQLDLLPERYLSMEHPISGEDGKAAAIRTIARYEVDGDGNVLRVSQPAIDIQIVNLCDCLPRIDVRVDDAQTLSHLALEAIHHYARLDTTLGFFLAYQIEEYITREKRVFDYYDTSPAGPEEKLPPQDRIRLYTGTENLLLEMGLELPQGERITDRKVRDKINSLIDDCLRQKV